MENIDKLIELLEENWTSAKEKNKQNMFQNLCLKYQALLEEESYLKQRINEVEHEKSFIVTNLKKIFNNQLDEIVEVEQNEEVSNENNL